MISPHSLGIAMALCGGVFATFIGCAVAIFAATEADRSTSRRAKRTRRA